MGGDLAIKFEQERIAKQEALLELPEDMGYTNQLIEELHEHIRDLQLRIQRENSWQSKFKDYLIGGFVGAIIGFTLSLLL